MYRARPATNKIPSTASGISFIISIKATISTKVIKHLTSTAIVGTHSALYFSWQGTANNAYPTSVAKVSVAARRDALQRRISQHGVLVSDSNYITHIHMAASPVSLDWCFAVCHGK
jgi:hypothetical protein